MKNKRFDLTAAVVFFLHGCVFAANQLLVNNISVSLGATETHKGMMIGAFYLGQAMLSVFFGELSEHLGKRKSAVLTSALVFAGSIILAFSGSVVLCIAGFFVFGAGLGSFETTMLALAADNNAGRSNSYLNFAQALFSIGSVLSPLLLGYLLPNDSYRAPYLIIALLVAAAAVYFSLDCSIDLFAVRDTVGGIRIFRLVKNPRMLLFMAAIALFIGSETMLIYWVFDYFEQLDFATMAAFSLSLYWFSSIAGRFLASRFKTARHLIAPSFLIAAVGFTLLILLPTVTGKLIGVAVAGIGFAPLYAGISSLAGDLFPLNSGAAYSLMIFSVNAGGFLFQFFIAPLAQYSRIEYAFVAAAGVCVLMSAVMALVLYRKSKAEAK